MAKELIIIHAVFNIK